MVIFMNDRILEQANHVMDIINKDYPDDDHVFFYNNTKLTQPIVPSSFSLIYDCQTSEGCLHPT